MQWVCNNTLLFTHKIAYGAYLGWVIISNIKLNQNCKNIPKTAKYHAEVSQSGL